MSSIEDREKALKEKDQKKQKAEKKQRTKKKAKAQKRGTKQADDDMVHPAYQVGAIFQ